MIEVDQHIQSAAPRQVSYPYDIVECQAPVLPLTRQRLAAQRTVRQSSVFQTSGASRAWRSGPEKVYLGSRPLCSSGIGSIPVHSSGQTKNAYYV